MPAAIETAARALDQLGVAAGDTLLINGASGNIGAAAVQLAVARGARVIGSASPAKHALLHAMGAEAVAYGAGMMGRIRALAPAGIDLALDVAGNGILPELIGLTGSPQHIVTVADVDGAAQHGVRFSRGDDGRALYALSQISARIAAGASHRPPYRPSRSPAPPLHCVGEAGRATGKLVLLIHPPGAPNRHAQDE